MRVFSTSTGQWRDIPDPEGITTETPSGSLTLGCTGCGGEKFVATSPAELESVLREHIQE